jgi:hypothetical protein
MLFENSPALRDAQKGDAYYLNSNVFPCITQNGTVLLHLSRNLYYGLAKSDAFYLERIVTNWPRQENNGGSSGAPIILDDASVRSLLQTLLRVEVLQQVPPRRSEINTAAISLDGSLVSVGDEIAPETMVDSIYLASFLFSMFSSAIYLRCRSLKSTVRLVSRRKARAIVDGYVYDRNRAAHFVFAFRRLRPYFFVADGHCLFHALTLINFLSIHGEYPFWVLGVRTGPWGAHSWVQQGDDLLDTNPEKICGYEPILAV